MTSHENKEYNQSKCENNFGYYIIEDRRSIDVIISKFFPPCFKVAETIRANKFLSMHLTGTRNQDGK